jgi:TRAP-type uncharacterized transport system substrate-binding protein
LAALALAVYFYFRAPRQHAYHLSLTAGNEVGTRHRLATRFRSEVERRGITLDIHPSLGSEQALDWVNNRSVDVALVQGSLNPRGRPDVRQVAALHVEPMHLLVKPELFRDVSASLSALRGKTVDLEEIGSGTHSLAVAILQFAGLESKERDQKRGYTAVSVPRQQILAETDTTKLPDAVFLISTLPSSTASHLVTKHGYRMVPLPFAEAFALGSLARTDSEVQHEAGNGKIIMGRIQAAKVPAFTYSLEPPVPEQVLPTLGTRLLLVAHKDVPARAVYELVEAVYASEFGQIMHPPLDAKLMELPPEYSWHEGAELYQHRNSPLLAGVVMDSARNGVAILAAAASGLFVLWQWSKQRHRFQLDRGFNKYISDVTRIEEKAARLEHDLDTPMEPLIILREELAQLKTEAVDRFTEGELVGPELMQGFLVQVHHVRDYVMRLINERNGTPRKRKPET